MKLHIAKLDLNRVGGGWTFQSNLFKGLAEYISDYDTADVYFITSPSMVERSEVEKAKADGKKIVLRIDNAVRNSRNRNTGMSRMKDFAEAADLIIYQSQWARNYLRPFLYKDGVVILNGVDLEAFSLNKLKAGDIVLYSRFNRDETKNWEVARFWFSQYQLNHPEAELWIVGQFSEELKQGNFDFYNNEKYVYRGVLNQHAMAKMYFHARSFLYTYFNDACSNTLIEALVSGCSIVGDGYYRSTGGAPEIMEAFIGEGRDYFSIKRMAKEYEEALLSL